jgi:hypothetical protein
MRRLFMAVAVLSLLIAGPVVGTVRADGDSPSREEIERSKQSQERMQREIKDSEKREKEQGAVARQRLAKEFHVDASKMSDSEAIIRLRDEVQARDEAQEQEKQRRREQAESQQEKQRRKVLDKQDAVLKETIGMDSDEIANDEGAAQEKMYEKMVQQGVAPQCRGKKGAALIACVDKVLDAQ